MTIQQLDVRGVRCVVAGVISVRDKTAPQRLDDLESELERLGAVVVGRVVQRRGVSRARNHASAMNLDAVMTAATVLGSGKTHELVAVVAEQHADLVVFLNALKSSQAARLASLAGCRVVSA
jgi:50S ribosomal subunit-associated GTPase HflX